MLVDLRFDHYNNALLNYVFIHIVQLPDLIRLQNMLLHHIYH